MGSRSAIAWAAAGSSALRCWFLSLGIGLAVATAASPADPPAKPPAPAELILDSGGFLSEVTGLTFSPDGTRLAAAAGKEVRIWDVNTGEPVATLRGQRSKGSYGNCYAVAFSPDGRHLLVGYDSYTEDGSIRVYETTRWDQISDLLPGDRLPVKNLAFSADGNYLASAVENGQIVLRRWSDRQIVKSLPPSRPDRPIYFSFGFPTSSPLLLTTGPDSAALVVVPEGVPAGPQTAIPEGLRQWLGGVAGVRYPFSSTPTRMCLRLDQGLWLAGGSGDSQEGKQYWAAVWRTGNPDPLAVYREHTYVVSAVDLSADGRWAASADIFGEIHLWDARTGAARHVFRGQGRPVYRAAFEPSGYNVGFTNKAHPAPQYDRNRFGTIDRVWQFEKRRVMRADPTRAYQTEVDALGDRRLRIELTDDLFYLTSDRSGSAESRYRFATGAMPMCFSFVRSSGLELPSLVLAGDDAGGLRAYNPVDRQDRRNFAGHESMVTSLSESPDGRLLLTSSSDRTIRIWSLAKYRPTGWMDFRTESDKVIEVTPGGSAAAAGVQVNDKFVALDGHNPTELEEMLLNGSFPYRPGQEVPFDMQRGGQPYRVTLRLRDGADAVSPLLTLFLADDDTWIVWTPQGYYDASPNAGRLIGWHLNQGPRRSAKFYPAEQFRRQLYRPDVIDQVLEAGDVREALARADASGPRPTDLLDLRRPEQLQRLEPPRVRILAPRDGSDTSTPQVVLQAEVSSQNDLPIREVTVLLNGRPIAEKAISVEPATSSPSGQTRTVVRNLTLEPGLNTISVVATNAHSSSVPETVRVTNRGDQREKSQGSLYLLAMGVSKYKSDRFNLKYAHRDAEEFIASWKRQEGPFYRKVESRLLVDEKATAANLRDAMDWLLRSVTQHDVAILFFSAHGVPDTRRNYYLGNHEIDPNRLRSTAVPSSDINRLVQDMPCKVLIFADTCHSAGITGAKALGDDPWQDLVAAETGAILFASSAVREVSLERDEWQHGAFTKAILETLADPKSDTNRSGYIEITEMDDHLSNRVKELTGGQQHPITSKPPTIRNIPIARAAAR